MGVRKLLLQSAWAGVVLFWSTGSLRLEGQNAPPRVAMDKPLPIAGRWMQRHEALAAKAKAGNIDLYFEGDSITDWWETQQKENWDHNFAGWRTGNFGIAGDKTQNVLYRIVNGEMEGVKPKVIVLLIGTNNLAGEMLGELLAAEIGEGIKACVDALHTKAPEAKILIVGVMARASNGSPLVMETISRINARISNLADDKTIKFLDLNDKLTDKNGNLLEGMMRDGLHPTDKGYQVWADAMKPILAEWLGPRVAATQPGK